LKARDHAETRTIEVVRDSKETRGIQRWLEQRINLTEFFSSLTIFGVLYTEIDTRRPLREALSDAFSRPLPAYARWPRILGPLALLVLCVELITGALLAFYYQPTAAAAHESVMTIASEVSFGWFVHQIHSWGSTLLSALLLLRLVRLAYEGFYRSPRELLWIASMLLLLLGCLSDFTGRLLPWSNAAYWSTVRGLETTAAIPVVGQLLAFLVGGTNIGDLTLIRFYVFHLALLPLALLACFAVSFGTVRRVGLSEIDDKPEAAAGRSQYRAHLINLLIALLFLFGGIVTVAVLVPMSFHGAADPLQTPSRMGPPWYLLAPYAVLELGPGSIPRVLRGVLILVIALVLLGMPFLARGGPERHPTLVSRLAVVLVLVAWGVLTYLGAALAGWTQ
jgi:ubiquinol-cytochrome c reductase cytochrome b subunit